MKKIKLEEGMTARVEGGFVVIEEAVKEFKAGDCVIGKDMFYPFTAKMVEYVHDGYVCRYDNDSNGCCFKYLRLATESEKKQLMSDLASKGKRWDAEKKQIVDLDKKPSVGDFVKLVYGNGKTYLVKIAQINGAQITESQFLSSNAESGVGDFFAYDSLEILTTQQLQSEAEKIGFSYHFSTGKFEKIKWTPKRGEVVNAGDGTIFLYKDGYTSGSTSYAALFGHVIYVGVNVHNYGFKQSTREERTEFFATLTKAGYKWNSKKLELKKVEKWVPKDGDFVTSSLGHVVIYKSTEKKSGAIITYCGVNSYSILTIRSGIGFGYTKDHKAASQPERQILLDALKKAGKTWNAELKRVEDIKPEVVEMTMEQVCEKLGMNVKIVKR